MVIIGLHILGRGSNTSSSGSDREDFLSLTSPSLPPQDLNIWSRCLRRLSSHSDILHGSKLYVYLAF